MNLSSLFTQKNLIAGGVGYFVGAGAYSMLSGAKFIDALGAGTASEPWPVSVYKMATDENTPTNLKIKFGLVPAVVAGAVYMSRGGKSVLKAVS